MRAFILYCLLLCFCAGCSRGGALEEERHVIIGSDDSYPVVEITTPANNQAFRSGNSVNITGTVSDNSLYQGTISIRDDATGTIVKEQYYEIHYIPVYNFNVSYTFSVTAPTDYTVIVKFEDHGQNKTIKAVQVTVTP